LIYTHSIIRHHPVKLIKETNGLWDLQLDDKITHKPQIVKNYKTGNYDILVQDVKNDLYLISNTGELRWKYSLGKPMLGKAHQIDIYKNKKLQFIFNTTDSLYCIDSKGRNVTKYPIALPDKTNNALSIFDYDRKKNYRILIGTEDGRLLNYDGNGTRVNGWKFTKARSPINEPAKHLKLAKKDYIITTTANGTVFLLDRRGKSRFKVKENVGDKYGHSFIFAKKDIRSSGIFYIDTLGQVIKLTFGGKKEYLPIKGMPGDKLIVLHIKSQKTMGFILYNDLKISIRKINGDKLMDYIVLEKLNETPNVYRLNDENWVGYSDKATQMAYMINFSGQPYSTFPINGLSPFSIKDINKDGILELVIADITGGVIVYALKE
jgi:outer membrane protein assembly factor BamB